MNGIEPADDEVFSFVLADNTGEVLQTVQNVGGEIRFAPLQYDQDDIGKTFIYTVCEATPSAGAMTCDPSVYTVEVMVIDNGDGTMKAAASVTLAGEKVDAIVFNNRLEAPLTISKKVIGCETAQTFAITVCFFGADGVEMKDPVAYTGDLTGQLISGESILLGDGQSITFSGLLPGMRYTVEEEANIAYSTTVNALPTNKAEGICSKGGNRADFVNTLKTTVFSVRKEWQGGDGGDIVLTLYANGEKMDPQPDYVRNDDTYTYTGLPMYDEDGDEVIYSAKEKYMDGYLTIYSNIFPYEGESKRIYDGGTIINRAVTSFRVRKVWSGLAEGEALPEITLTLYCNGEAMSRKQPEPNQDGWYIYKNLPRTVDGESAVYYVMEEPVNGYMTSYADADGQENDRAYDGGTITNSKVPQTGDNASMLLWTAMLAGASVMLLALKSRRRQQ